LSGYALQSRLLSKDEAEPEPDTSLAEKIFLLGKEIALH
jgi:hypothetical protein